MSGPGAVFILVLLRALTISSVMMLRTESSGLSLEMIDSRWVLLSLSNLVKELRSLRRCEAATCNLDGLAAGRNRVHCCHVLKALPHLVEIPLCKSLLHFIFVSPFGNFYGVLDLSVDLLLFRFRANEKNSLFLIQNFFQNFGHPRFFVRKDCDPFGGNDIVHTERDVC